MTDYDHLLDLDSGDDIPPSKLDLETIPRRLWQELLAPLESRQRAELTRRVRDARLFELASRLVAELDMADSRRRVAAAEARFKARLREAAALRPAAKPGAPHARQPRAT